jgi:hypothetical protein
LLIMWVWMSMTGMCVSSATNARSAAAQGLAGC